jgi:hypothetical protein
VLEHLPDDEKAAALECVRWQKRLSCEQGSGPVKGF